MVCDPEPEQCSQGIPFKGAGEGERHESPHKIQWLPGGLSHQNEPHVFIHLLLSVRSSVTEVDGTQRFVKQVEGIY